MLLGLPSVLDWNPAAGPLTDLDIGYVMCGLSVERRVRFTKAFDRVNSCVYGSFLLLPLLFVLACVSLLLASNPRSML